MQRMTCRIEGEKEIVIIDQGHSVWICSTDGTINAELNRPDASRLANRLKQWVETGRFGE